MKKGVLFVLLALILTMSSCDGSSIPDDEYVPNEVTEKEYDSSDFHVTETHVTYFGEEYVNTADFNFVWQNIVPQDILTMYEEFFNIG